MYDTWTSEIKIYFADSIADEKSAQPVHKDRHSTSIY